MEPIVKGIVFDMDNTILRSRIDFPAMKRETYAFLVSKALLPDGYALSEHTTSTLIEEAARSSDMTEQLLRELWAIPTKHEVAGMRGADLEPGAREVLARLHGDYRIAIVTNNSVDAAEQALRGNGILAYFDLLIGRESVQAMKPSPDGHVRVLREYPFSADEWLSVGDSWIDGKASIDAGIKFIAYRSDGDKLKQMNVKPYAAIDDLFELLPIIERINGANR